MKKSYLQQIEEYLRSEGFTDPELMVDLKDHLATEIELLMTEGEESFEDSFEQAKAKLLPNTPYQLERDLKLLTTQKHNIMIKKIAYIGGYVSALCLVFSLLFFSQSLLGKKESSLKISAMEVEWYMKGEESNTEKGRKTLNDMMNSYHVDQLIDQSNKFQNAEILLLMSVLTFSITYLPYRFYSGYQKSNLEIA